MLSHFRKSSAFQFLLALAIFVAISMVAVLQAHGEIDGDALALAFGKSYLREPGRGYGAAMHRLLPLLARGDSWQNETSQLFGGQGSFINWRHCAMMVSSIEVSPLDY